MLIYTLSMFALLAVAHGMPIESTFTPNTAFSPNPAPLSESLLDVIRGKETPLLPSLSSALKPEALQLLREIDFKQLSQSCDQLIQRDAAGGIVQSIVGPQKESRIDIGKLLSTIGRTASTSDLCELVAGLNDPDALLKQAVQTVVDALKKVFPMKKPAGGFIE